MLRLIVTILGAWVGLALLTLLAWMFLVWVNRPPAWRRRRRLVRLALATTGLGVLGLSSLANADVREQVGSVATAVLSIVGVEEEQGSEPPPAGGSSDSSRPEPTPNAPGSGTAQGPQPSSGSASSGRPVDKPSDPGPPSEPSEGPSPEPAPSPEPTQEPSPSPEPTEEPSPSPSTSPGSAGSPSPLPAGPSSGPSL